MNGRLKAVKLYAWLGEDELGSGEIGIKAGITRAGYIPLVAVREDRMTEKKIMAGLSHVNAKFGKTMYLCEYTFKCVKQVITKA